MAIMDLPLNIDLIYYAIEQEQETFIWELWKSLYPNMMSGFQQFISYEDYKKSMCTKKQKFTEKPYDEIEEEMLQVIEEHERR